MNKCKVLFLIFWVLNFNCENKIKEKFNKYFQWVKTNPKKCIFIGLTLISQVENILSDKFSLCVLNYEKTKKINYKGKEHSKFLCKIANAIGKIPFFGGIMYVFGNYSKNKKCLITLIPFFGTYYFIYKNKNKNNNDNEEL